MVHWGAAQVVPEMMVGTLEEVVVVREHSLVRMDAQVDKTTLRELAQLRERAHLADLGARIAQLADGVRTLHG